MRWIRSGRPSLAWLQGPGPSDLWIWTDETGAQTLELSFYGRTIVSRPGSLQTGLHHHAESSPYARETGLVELDPSLREDTLRAGLALLESLAAGVANELTSRLAAELSRALEILAANPQTGEPGPKL
jgi:hypothetical protein